MTSIWTGLARGAAAGAAGTSALNVASSLDAAVRARPASDLPQQLVAASADAAGVQIPGGRTERARRIEALGPLAGTLTGVGVGGLAGVLRASGVRLPTLVGGPLLGVAAMLASDVPLALARLSDPRRWTAADWAADIVPHLAYGISTHAALVAMSREQELREQPPRPRASTLLRAAALGAATGARSSAGAAAVAFTSAGHDRGRIASTLGSRPGTALAGLLAAGELVLDKAPSTPSRTAAQGFVPRVVLGAGSAAGMARRDGDEPGPAAVAGLAGAVAATLLGVRLRAAAARRFGSDRPGALAEDAAAALLGWLGARRR